MSVATNTETTSPMEVPSGTKAERGVEMVARARSLTSLIISEADKIEEQKRVTEPIVQAMRDAGLFWILVPQALGGSGLSVAKACEVIEEVSYGDGSTGWAFMANSIGNNIASGYLEPEGAQELFGGEDKAITCGFSGPVGTAVEVEGGYIAKAPRLSFGSGSDYATHIGSGVRVVDENGETKRDENGNILARFVYAPRENIKFHGNWDVMGMVGTGSVDYELPEQFIPSKFAVDTFSTTPYRDEGAYSYGLWHVSVAGHTPVALGMMRRALEEVVRYARDKKRSGHDTTIAENSLFKRDFAMHEANYQSARDYAYKVFDEAENRFEEEGSLTPADFARIQQVASWSHMLADEAISFAQTWAGGSGFRNPSPLGRITRDMAVAKGHLLIDQTAFTKAAGPIIDEWADNPAFENAKLVI